MMNMAISYAVVENICFIKLVGSVRYMQAGGFDWLHGWLIEHPEINDVVVDMEDVFFADSTTFGMLAKIAKLHIQRSGKKPLLVCAHPEVAATLDSMDFGRVFQIVGEWEGAPPVFGGLSEDIFEPPDAKMLWEAHEVLCQLSERNEIQFRDVTELFEAEIV